MRTKMKRKASKRIFNFQIVYVVSISWRKKRKYYVFKFVFI